MPFRHLTAALLLCSAAAVQAHDLPFVGNSAAEEAMTIERAARLENSRPGPRNKFFSLVASKMRWNRTVLDVCFWNGDAALRGRVSATADELTRNLAIKFRWGGDCPGPSTAGGAWENVPVRVSLARDGTLLVKGDDPSSYFAMIGREVSFDRRATVNLPFSGAPDDALLRNKVLHEFCHVLGCLHEHQRAGCADLFDKVAIMSAYNLSDALYRRNFEVLPAGGVYGPSSLRSLDAESVMLYAFRRDMFVAGSSPVCLRDAPATRVSSLDEEGLLRLYSQPALPTLMLRDFPVLEARNRRVAENKRKLLKRYSTVLADQPGSPAAKGLEVAVNSLRAQAEAAELEADSFAATPEDLALVKAALFLLPKD